MISATLGILIVEIAVVSLVAVGVVAFWIWKQKKRRTVEFEQLLQNIENQQGERKAQLVQYLMKDYTLAEAEAKESSEYMVEAEKQFMQLFIKQQIEQTTVIEFYAHLGELLDQYLYFVPKIAEQKKTVEVSKSKAVEAEKKQKNTDDENKQEPAPKQDKNEEEPDWGDAFAESGEEMDEEVKDSYEQEQKKE